MADAQLSTSITSISERASEVAVSASADELQKISRVAPSLEQSENAALEVAINTRAAAIAGTATAADLKKIGKAIGNMLEPQTTSVSGEFIGSQTNHAGKFFSTNGTARNWGGVTMGGLQQVQLSTIENDQTLVYNSVSGKFENSSRAFDIPQYSLTQNLPASANAGEVVFDVQSSQLKYWDGSEWKVAAVVAAAGGGGGDTDSNFSNVSLLLNGDGNAILDLTGKNNINTVGDVQISTSVKKFGTGSVKFDGTGDYLDVSGTSDLNFGTGDFTIEFWLNLNSKGSTLQAITDPRSADSDVVPLIWIRPDGRVYYYTNGANQIEGTTVLNTGQWYHVALVKNGNTTTLYLDGTSEGSVIDTLTYTQPTTFRIGQRYTGTAYNLDGYLDDFRITKGVARYTSNFTAPTSAHPTSAAAGGGGGDTDSNFSNVSLLLNGDGNAILDLTGKNNINTVGDVQISTSVKKFGTGSVKFDGTGDYLDVSGTSDLNFGTGDFTIEFWLNLNSKGSTLQAITDPRSADSDVVPLIWIRPDGRVYYYTNGANQIEGTTVLNTGQWYHVALVKNGNTTTLYLDGTSEGSVIDTLTYTQPTTFRIGQRYTGTAYNLDGYLDDFRITKGVARYTSNFTAPTSAHPTSAAAGGGASGVVTDYHTTYLTETGGTLFEVTYSGSGVDSLNATIDSMSSGDALLLSAGQYVIDSTVGNDSSYGQSLTRNKDIAIVGNTLEPKDVVVTGNPVQSGEAYTIFEWNSTLQRQFANMRLVRIPVGTHDYQASISGNNPGAGSGKMKNVILDFNGGNAAWAYRGVGLDTNSIILENISFVNYSTWLGNHHSENYHITVINSGFEGTYNKDHPLHVNSSNLVENVTYDSNYDYTDTTLYGHKKDMVASQESSGESAGGSAIFDGSGDWIEASTGDEASFNIGTDDFTIEFWMNLADVSGSKSVISLIRDHAANENQTPHFYMLNASLVYWVAGADRITASETFLPNTWYHIALSKSGSTHKLFVNGVNSGTDWENNYNYAQGRPVIGSYYSSLGTVATTQLFNGHMSDVRIVKGTAVYTANFTPPTEPLTAITNTSLLLSANNVIVDSSTNSHAIAVSGDVQQVSLSPYAAGGSGTSVDWSPLTISTRFEKSVYDLTDTAPELLTNPSFESEDVSNFSDPITGWNDVASGWYVENSSAIMANTGSWKPLVAGPLGLTIGQTYKAEIVISAITGSIKFDLGTSNGSYIRGNTTQGLGITVTETGTHSFTFTYNGYTAENTAYVDYIGFGRADVNGSSATVDSVSLKLANAGGTTGESDLAVDMSETHTVIGIDKAYSGYGAIKLIDNSTGVVQWSVNNPNPVTAGSFGRRNSVGTDGTHVVVGNRDQDEVYVYNMSGTLLRTISGPDAGAQFGHSVKIDGDYIAVGGYNQDKAYICSTSTGAVLHTLTNPNVYGSTPDQFGQVVDISGNFMVVSTVEEDAADGSNSGVAYVYTVDAGSLLHTFVNPNAHGTSALDNFGIDCALDGNYLVVGAFGESDAAVGSGSGKAYFYNVATGTLLHTIDNPNPDNGSEVDYMGWSVAVDGQTALVSAWYETGTAGADAGKCYIYDIVSGNLLHTIEDPNFYSAGGIDDRFGSEVAIAGNYFAVSAKGEDHASQDNVGALYVFKGE